MPDEMLDIYDDNLRLIGVKPRKQVHEDGDWHRSFHCWIIAEREGQRYVLFQLRGPEKAVYPNTLDITAAGHLTHGESIEDGIRELEEELGIAASYDALQYLGVRCDVALIGPVTNREFCDTYLLRDDRALTEYKLQASEVAGLVEMTLADGLRLFAEEMDTVEVTSLRPDRDGQYSLDRRSIGTRDIIPRTDRYYLKVCIMAERHFESKRYLAI